MGTLAQKRLSGESGWAVQRTQSFKAALKASMNLGTVGARVYDGVDQRHGIAYNMPWGTDDFTIETWIYPTAPSGSQFFISFGGSSATTAGVLLQLSGTSIYFRVSNGLVSPPIYTLGTVTANTWHHLVVSVNRTTGIATGYINGVAQTPADVSLAAGSWSQTHTKCAIGGYRYDSSSFTLTGSMSRARIALGYAYTAVDALESYNKGNGKYQAELSTALASKITHSWNMNEGSGDLIDNVGGLDMAEYGTDVTISAAAGPREATAADLEGGNHGTLTNFADTVNCWKTDVPHGSYSSTKAETASQVELLTDGGFENVTGEAFDDWVESAMGSSTVNVETSDVHSGSACVRLDIDASNSYASVYQNVLTVGQQYTLTLWAKASAAGKAIAIDGLAGVQVNITTEWAQYTVTQTATSNNLVIKRQNGTSSSLYIDDVSCKLTSFAATMTRFDDVDVAHVDGPEGSWGPYISDQGSGGNGGWLQGDLKDSRSAKIPSKLDVDYSLAGNGARSAKIEDDPSLDGSGEMTVAGWMYHSGTNSNYLISKRYNGSGWGLYVASTETVTFYHGDTAVRCYGTTGNVPIGEWVHIAAVWDGSQARVYLNGVDVTATDECTEIESPNSEPVFIGSRSGGSGNPAAFINAGTYIANAAYYDEALTPTEIESLAGCSSTGSPVGKWEFDQTLSLPYISGAKGIQLDGTDDHLVIGDLPSMSCTDPHTFTAWVKTEESGRGIIIGNYDGYPSLNIEVYTGGILRVFMAGSTSGFIDITCPDPVISDGHWHHIAVTYDGTQTATGTTLYIDGNAPAKNVNLDTTPTGNFDNASGFHIGCDGRSGSYFLDGTIADTRYYSAALTQAQIRQLIAGTDYTTDLAAEWPFTDSTRTIPSTADGYSLEFDGTAYVDCDDVLPVEAGDYDCGAWIKTSTNDSSLRGVIAKGISSAGGIFCLRVQNGLPKAVFQADGQLAAFSEGTTNVCDGSWHHLWMSLDRNDVMTLYVDGVAEGTPADISSYTADTGHQNSPLVIGNYLNAAGDPFMGLIDDPRVLKGANYSADDIATIAAGGEPSTAPTSRWSLDDGPQHGEPSIGDPIVVWGTYLGDDRIEFTQEDADARPTVEEDASGKRVIRFSGNEHMLAIELLLTQNAGAVQIVYKADDTGSYAVFSQCKGALNNYGYLRSAASTINWLTHDGGGETQLRAEPYAPDLYIVTIYSDGSKTFALIDNEEHELSTIGGANDGEWFGDMTGLTKTMLGALDYSGSASLEFDGDLYECVFWDGVPSPADLKKNAAKLVAKYQG